MALQEVVRDWIYLFNAQYLTRVDMRLSENSLSCRSCSEDFVNNDVVHAQYKSRGSTVKRHLQCAILHHVITMTEAKQLAPSGVTINWREISASIPVLLEQRRKMFMARLACLALSISMFGVNFINTLL